MFEMFQLYPVIVQLNKIVEDWQISRQNVFL